MSVMIQSWGSTQRSGVDLGITALVHIPEKLAASIGEYNRITQQLTPDPAGATAGEGTSLQPPSEGALKINKLFTEIPKDFSSFKF